MVSTSHLKFIKREIQNLQYYKKICWSSHCIIYIEIVLMNPDLQSQWMIYHIWIKSTLVILSPSITAYLYRDNLKIKYLAILCNRILYSYNFLSHKSQLFVSPCFVQSIWLSSKYSNQCDLRNKSSKRNVHAICMDSGFCLFVIYMHVWRLITRLIALWAKFATSGVSPAVAAARSISQPFSDFWCGQVQVTHCYTTRTKQTTQQVTCSQIV